MKKYIASLAIAAVAAAGTMVSAQEAPSCAAKKQYLPEAGDWALGVDVVPLVKAIGGAFNSDEQVPVGGNPFTYDTQFPSPTVSVMGKYMLTDKWGIRVNLGVLVKAKNHRLYTADDLGNYLHPDSYAKVVDNEKTTRSGGSLMAGAEYRLGKRRVQGVFGFGVLFGFSTNKTSYSYGNEITEFNRTPSTALSPATFSDVPAGYRLTEAYTDGPNFAVGAYASAGVEWFVAPKIALGADVNLNIYGIIASQGYVKSEGYNEAYRRVEERTDLVTPGDRSFNLGTDNVGGSLYMTFYF